MLILLLQKLGTRKGSLARSEGSHAELIEAGRVFLGSDFKVYHEDEVCLGEVQLLNQKVRNVLSRK